MNKSPRKVGVLMLDTRFPRLPGDIGNPEGFDFELVYQVVEGASPHLVVREQSPGLLEPFVVAANRLVEQGAEIITTSCGFLYMFQKELQSALPVPVLTSSLLLLPKLEKQYGNAQVGLLTISASSLDKRFRTRTGIRDDVPIGTTENGSEFTVSILEDRSDFDIERCRDENVDAAMRLVRDNPGIRAILLECTNMPPHAAAISDATGLPVYSLNTLLSDYFATPNKRSCIGATPFTIC